MEWFNEVLPDCLVVDAAQRWILARWCSHLERWEPVAGYGQDYLRAHDEAECRCVQSGYRYGVWDRARSMWAVLVEAHYFNSMCCSTSTYYGKWEDEDGVHTYPHTLDAEHAV